MSGVEILTSEQMAMSSDFCWPAFIITLIFSIMLLLACAINDGAPVLLGIFMGIVVGGMLGSLVGIVFSKPTDYTTVYKVTISEEVSMLDFYNKYHVMEQEGRIFTVTEKEQEVEE